MRPITTHRSLIGRPVAPEDVAFTKVLHRAYLALRPVLFAMDPEDAHHAMIGLLSGLPGPIARRTWVPMADDPVTVGTLTFRHRIGLAAGLDKFGTAARCWGGLGFSFAELGTITPRPQPGNPRPRVFRLPQDEALINRMGFNSDGPTELVGRLQRWGAVRGRDRLGIKVGCSIGKNKLTPNAQFVDDYVQVMRAVAPVADYVAINVSSPNTPGLRELQDPSALGELLRALAEVNQQVAGADPIPIWLKLAPDLTWAELDAIIEVAEAEGVQALVATNTTIARPDGLHGPNRQQAGGLSGRPLTLRAREVVAHIAEHSRLPVVGAGGIMNGPDAAAMVDAGASLVQLYTGFIYHGPALNRVAAGAIAARGTQH